MNGSRTARPSSPRTFFPLFILSALLLALVAAAPALAYDDWEHGGASESTCDSSGCHKDGQAITNTACTTCHSGFTTSGSQKCWDCHAPGTTPSSSCTDSCHLFQANGDHPAYPTVFTHGATPHLGASGYGKSCTACHGAGNAHHDAAGASVPACATCHNGGYAAAPTAHAGFGTDCAACHEGMNRPSADCSACHVGDPGSGGPQITYSNDLACSDVGCHGKVANHSGTPIAAAPCTTCHTAHFESLGACTTCHADAEVFHHGTTTATPLADCASCHDGTIAPAKQAHAGQSCSACHEGMARPPVPATCQNCHDAQTFGAVDCATCHSATGWIGKETIHATDPAATVACTTCHETPHYEDLGTCDSCHGSHAGTHHGTATLADTQLKLAARPATIRARTKATLTGRLLAGGKALAAQRILIQRRIMGGAFKKVAVVKTGANGRFSRVVKPRVSTDYRAVWRPAGAYVAQQRPAIAVVKLRVRK